MARCKDMGNESILQYHASHSRACFANESPRSHHPHTSPVQEHDVFPNSTLKRRPSCVGTLINQDELSPKIESSDCARSARTPWIIEEEDGKQKTSTDNVDNDSAVS